MNHVITEKTQFTLWDRFRYQFDNTMSKGTTGLIVWLFTFAALLALVTTAILTATGNAPQGFGFADLWWDTMQRVTGVRVEKGHLSYVVTMAVPMFGSMFVGGLLVGLIVGGIQNKLRNLRKGRSRVVERDHTVILGWAAPQIFTLISELVQANASRRRACIVVLAEKDKVEMEDAIREKVGNTLTTKVVCRTGNPMDPLDLELVNPRGARAFVILSAGAEHSDTVVIKSLLALAHGKGPEAVNVVAEMKDERKMAAARLIGAGAARLVHVDSFLSRITVQASRQAGLSLVYQELLNFEGSEIYIHSEPSLRDRTFGDALTAYEDCCVIGLQRGKQTWFNPPADTKIEVSDRIVLIAQDEDQVHLVSGKPAVREEQFRSARSATPTPERTLILGWNRRAPQILLDLDAYVGAGSEAVVVADAAGAADVVAALGHDMKHSRLSFRLGDTTDGRILDSLDLQTFHHVILLSSDRLPPQEADGAALVTLLHLREIGDRHGNPFTVVSEMADPRNRVLAGVARADDFILSDQLVTQLLAQLSENPDLSFDDLFDPQGNELYMKPAQDYVVLGEPVDFYTVTASARRRGETAVGYRLAAHIDNPSRSYGVKVNPKKSEPVVFEEKDRVIVLAEE